VYDVASAQMSLDLRAMNRATVYVDGRAVFPKKSQRVRSPSAA
jgi:hypothetical protein